MNSIQLTIAATLAPRSNGLVVFPIYHRMMRILPSACLYFLLVATVAFGQSKPPTINPDTAATRLGTRFVNVPGNVGLSVGVYDNGRTYFYNFGTTENSQKKPPTQHTIYEIGSVTKTFTSLLLAQAVTEKKLNLNDDIRKYLDGKYPNLAYQGQPIRLVHLANTTSALPDNLPDKPEIFRNPNPDSIAQQFYRLHINRTRKDFYADLQQVKLTRAPGTVPQHSNVAAELLGYILERVYKMPYEALVKQYITDPSQMTSTNMAPAVPKAKASMQAKGHGPTSQVTPYHTLPDLQIAGGLNSTTTDLLKYLQLHLNSNNAAVKLSHQPTFGSPESEAVALNWFITKTVDSNQAFTHTGGSFGFASYCVFYPALNRGLVLLANRNDGSTESRLAELAAAIEEGTYGLSPALTDLRTELQKRDFAQAFEVMQEVKKKHPKLHLSESYVNSWGYALLRSGKKRQAVEMFKLNVGLYPKSANTYDSLGEAYEVNGEKQLAITNFKRSVALNPANLNAVDHLKKLEAGGTKTSRN